MGVAIELDAGGVMMATIVHPPVNAVAIAVRRGLLSALREADADPAVTAVVITGSARVFSAGADLAEFDAGTAMDPPSLHGDILPYIAAMSKPVVAALRGAALGGGLELALGCHARVASPSTKVGLPETTLGLMPGAGGTQWLPRAVGVARAVALIVDGSVTTADALRGTAAFDRIVADGDVLAAASALALELATAGRPFATLDAAPLDDPDAAPALAAARARLLAGPDPLPGRLSALDAIALATRFPVADGMPREFALFEPLIRLPEARALRHVFVAERRAGHRASGDAGDNAGVDAIASALRSALGDAFRTLAARGVPRDAALSRLARWGWPCTVGGPVGVADDRDPDLPQTTATSDDVAGTDVVELCVLAAVNAGARLLDDGVAAAAADVDVAAIRACAFPAVRGGPMFQGDERGVAQVVDRLRALDDAHPGFGWAPAPLLASLVASGRSLRAARSPDHPTPSSGPSTR